MSVDAKIWLVTFTATALTALPAAYTCKGKPH